MGNIFHIKADEADQHKVHSLSLCDGSGKGKRRLGVETVKFCPVEDRQ